MTAEPILVQSENYSLNYGNFWSCVYLFISLVGETMKIRIIHLDLEDGYDFLKMGGSVSPHHYDESVTSTPAIDISAVYTSHISSDVSQTSVNSSLELQSDSAANTIPPEVGGPREGWDDMSTMLVCACGVLLFFLIMSAGGHVTGFVLRLKSVESTEIIHTYAEMDVPKAYEAIPLKSTRTEPSLSDRGAISNPQLTNVHLLYMEICDKEEIGGIDQVEGYKNTADYRRNEVHQSSEDDSDGYLVPNMTLHTISNTG